MCVGQSHSPTTQEAEANRITCPARASLGYTVGTLFQSKEASKQKLQIQARPRRAGRCLAACLVNIMLTPPPMESTLHPDCQMRQTVLSCLPLSYLPPSLLGKGLISGKSKSRRHFSVFYSLGQLLLSEKKMQTLAFARKDVCVFLIYIYIYYIYKHCHMQG